MGKRHKRVHHVTPAPLQGTAKYDLTSGYRSPRWLVKKASYRF